MEVVDLAVSTSAQSRLRSNESVELQWNAAYDQSEISLPELSGSALLTVLTRQPWSDISRSKTALVVDGSLSEWPPLPVAVTEPIFTYGEEIWSGPDDCSWRFGVMYDDEYLYVGVDVRDDDPVYREQKQYPWEQDGVEIRIDARPDPMRSLSRSRSGADYDPYVIVWLAPGKTPDQTFLHEGELAGEFGVRAVGILTAGGHSCEVAIPISYIREKQGAEWDKLRINVTVDDVDGGDTLCQLWWQHQWSAAKSYPGSGTFYRQ